MLNLFKKNTDLKYVKTHMCKIETQSIRWNIITEKNNKTLNKTREINHNVWVLTKYVLRNLAKMR